MFDGLEDEAELTFVEYERNWGDGLDPGVYSAHGTLTTWESHRSAQALLDHDRPDLVAMLAITSRNQIALRAAAARRGIEVVHVEHGYRLPAVVKHDPRLNASLRSGPRGSLRTNRFYLGSLLRSGPGPGARLAASGISAFRSGSDVAGPRLAAARRPDRYLSFAPECFAYHRDVDRVPPDLAAATEYVGVPQFDGFDRDRAAASADAGLAVMADHQLHNIGIRGWTDAFREDWAKRLVGVLAGRSMRLVVKVHPGDRSRVWDRVGGTPGVVTVVDSVDELAAHAARASTVLATGSTLQLPMVGLANTATIALEIHPDDGPALSGRLSEVGVADAVTSFPELDAQLDRLGVLRSAQAPSKDEFVARFLHTLDGGARLRLQNALLRTARAAES